jgi:hypothetical protein
MDQQTQQHEQLQQQQQQQQQQHTQVQQKQQLVFPSDLLNTGSNKDKRLTSSIEKVVDHVGPSVVVSTQKAKEEDEEEVKPTTERDKFIQQVGNRIRYLTQRLDAAGIVSREHVPNLGFRNNPEDGRPAYSDIVDESGTLTTDVSDLLQFAVIGFGKCGYVLLFLYKIKYVS